MFFLQNLYLLFDFEELLQIVACNLNLQREIIQLSNLRKFERELKASNCSIDRAFESYKFVIQIIS